MASPGCGGEWQQVVLALPPYWRGVVLWHPGRNCAPPMISTVGQAGSPSAPRLQADEERPASIRCATLPPYLYDRDAAVVLRGKSGKLRKVFRQAVTIVAAAPTRRGWTTGRLIAAPLPSR